MEIGQVVGTVVSTAKDKKLSGKKLLVVNLISPEGVPTKNHVIAVDTVGAGEGEMVLIVRGSSARQAKDMEKIPTDTSIIAIIDSLEFQGKIVYKKFGNKTE